MPRIRTIKPELWDDEKLGQRPRDERLLFIGLFSKMADDQGRFRAHPSVVRSSLFPYDDDIPLATVKGWLEGLESAGFIGLYDEGGQVYGAITNWHHQKVTHPARPRLPEPSSENLRPSSEKFRESLESLRNPPRNSETLTPHTSDLVPSTTDRVPPTADPPREDSPEELPEVVPEPDDPPPADLAPEPPAADLRERRPTRARGRPVTHAEEVIREWNEVMVPQGYPEALDTPELRRAIDAVTAQSHPPHSPAWAHTLDWWRETVFMTVHGSWCGVPAAPKGGPASLLQLAGFGLTKILDLVARFENAQKTTQRVGAEPPPKPGSATHLAQMAARGRERARAPPTNVE